MNPIAQFMLAWVNGRIACGVAKLVIEYTEFSIADNPQLTNFKLEELEVSFRCLCKAVDWITSTTSSTLEPYLLYLTAIELDLTTWAHLETAVHTPIPLRSQQVDNATLKWCVSFTTQ